MDIFSGAFRLASRLHLAKPDWIKQVKLKMKQFTEMQNGLIVNFYKEPM